MTINVLNPGGGANTEGMAEEMRAASREGRGRKLVEPDQMVPPLLYLVSDEAAAENGRHFDAHVWDTALPWAEAARLAGRRAGILLHSTEV